MKCQICGTSKTEKFYNGITSFCKTHWKERVKKNRKENAEHYRAFDKKRANRPDRVAARKEYSQTENGKLSHAKAHRKWLENNTVKRAAHIIVGNSVRNGKLIRKACERCGKKKAQAHHEDYTKPLEVIWLCAKHHAEIHKY